MFRETFYLNLQLCYPNDGGGRFLQHTGTDLPNDSATPHKAVTLNQKNCYAPSDLDLAQFQKMTIKLLGILYKKKKINK